MAQAQKKALGEQVDDAQKKAAGNFVAFVGTYEGGRNSAVQKAAELQDLETRSSVAKGKATEKLLENRKNQLMGEMTKLYAPMIYYMASPDLKEIRGDMASGTYGEKAQGTVKQMETDLKNAGLWNEVKAIEKQLGISKWDIAKDMAGYLVPIKGQMKTVNDVLDENTPWWQKAGQIATLAPQTFQLLCLGSAIAHGLQLSGEAMFPAGGILHNFTAQRLENLYLRIRRIKTTNNRTLNNLVNGREVPFERRI